MVQSRDDFNHYLLGFTHELDLRTRLAWATVSRMHYYALYVLHSVSFCLS
jgi:hypothetical protein